MKLEQKNNRKLMPLIIILSFITLAIWGIVLGLYYYETEPVNMASHTDNAYGGTLYSDSMPQGKIRYERIDVYKVNAGPIIRFVYEALIEEETSKSELIRISERIVEEMIEERRGFQALAIHYYTHKELLGHPPALGIYTYAPYGDWSNAGIGKSDFSNFEGNASQLIEKDWAKQPSKEEVEMFQLYSKYEHVDDGIKEVSNRYNISFEEARDSINKVMNWIYR